jgi:cytochrome c oxidase cbb3-type subunit 2
MNRLFPLILVSLGLLAFATAMLVILPAAQIRRIEPPPQLSDYGPVEQRGRDLYVSLGCYYCHSQQPRLPEQAPDMARGWGRPSTAADYVFDQPHVLGTMRTGPDLLNVGARIPSRNWHLTHLYQPRAVEPASLMPAYPFLFEIKAEAGEDDVRVRVPPQHRPDDGVVIAKPEALALVAYLKSLDRTYPISHPELRDNGFDAEPSPYAPGFGLGSPTGPGQEERP